MTSRFLMVAALLARQFVEMSRIRIEVRDQPCLLLEALLLVAS